jgi:hypothetical protein
LSSYEKNEARNQKLGLAYWYVKCFTRSGDGGHSVARSTPEMRAGQPS